MQLNTRLPPHSRQECESSECNINRSHFLSAQQALHPTVRTHVQRVLSVVGGVITQALERSWATRCHNSGWVVIEWEGVGDSSHEDKERSMSQPSVLPPPVASAACLTTAAFEHPSPTWYLNPSSTSFVEDPAGHEREYVEHSKIMDFKSSGISRRNLAKDLSGWFSQRQKGQHAMLMDATSLNWIP